MRIALIAGFLLAAPGLAAGADLPVKAPAQTIPAVALFNWTGAYLGGHAGYRWARSNTESGFPFSSLEMDGSVAGVQGGLLYQWDRFVAGIEADVSWGEGDGEHVAAGPVVRGLKITRSFSVRGRFGFATGRWLSYLTAGYTRADFEARFSQLGLPFVHDSRALDGWTGGLGVEWAPVDWGTVRLEYLYANYESGVFAPGPGVVLAIRHAPETHTVRLAVNVRFAGP